VEGKGKAKYQIPIEDMPKAYISTNNAITSNGASDKRRQYTITFSNYYNADRNPEAELGKKLFDDWDHSEWELFYNAMALCVKYYLIYGKVESNDESIKKRQLRQEIGEEFLNWVDEYFSDATKFDIDNERRILQAHFFEHIPNQIRQYYTPNKFKKKFKQWCEYMGYVFNPEHRNEEGKPGEDNKKGGVEYFMVSKIDIPF
jgi:hypothetical protein